MKFLMNKFFLPYFIIFSFSFCAKCIDVWFQNTSLNNQPFKLKAFFNTNDLVEKPIEIYIDSKNSKIKIVYDKQDILLMNDKTMKLFKETNQLYIDNPDTSLSKIILSIFDDIDDEKNYIEISKTEYTYTLQDLSLSEIYIKYNDSCKEINQIKIINDHQNISIYDISIDYIDKDNILSIFDISGNYFIYDLRE
tara:strand:+ start:61 stop:642 length:582 start_codon:yes stop_codon:yes gene_type:complete